MSKEQIEEMAKYCPCYFGEKCCIDGELPEKCDMLCQFGTYAEILYNAGYRKQSGWISVDEKSPDEEKAYIIVTDGETVIVARRAWLYRSNSDGRLRCPANYGNGMYITHWMPLPEPPKMKGGE